MSRSVKFSSFIMGGYECNGALALHKRYNDLVDTKHSICFVQDYRLLKEIGIKTVREGLLWNNIDRGQGKYDFFLYEQLMSSGKEEGIQQIWDLNHFDYPVYLNPYSHDFIEAFSKYAVEAVKLIRKYQAGTIFIVPFNEISFFAFMGGTAGGWAPFHRDPGPELKVQCVLAVISAINAIKLIDKDIRFINVDPLMIRRSADEKNIHSKSLENDFNEIVYETFDLLSGKKNPEYGGSPEHLDIVGINHYPSSQEWVRFGKNSEIIFKEPISWLDPGWTPLSEVLTKVATRYNRPMILSETGAWGDLRECWWEQILLQVDISLQKGLDLNGVCAYPVIDRRDWSKNHLTNSGLWDFAENDASCNRVPFEPAIKVIKNYILKGGTTEIFR